MRIVAAIAPGARLARFIVAVAALAAAPAYAQNPGGPFSALFGVAEQPIGSEYTVVDFRSASGMEWDDGLFVDRTFSGPQDGSSGDARHAGFAAAIDGRLSLVRHTTMSHLIADAMVIHREYFAEPAFGASSERGVISYSVNPTSRFGFSGTGSVSRQPFFQMISSSLFESPDWVVSVPSTPFAVVMQRNLATAGQAGFSYFLTKRASLTGQASRSHISFDEASTYDFDTTGYQGSFRYQISRDLAFRSVYGTDRYRVANNSDPFIHERIDVGVDYLRNISLARRLTFEVTTQTGLVRELNGPRRFRLDGTARLMKWFRRTWRTALSAQRNTEFIAGFAQPVFTDTVNAAIGGMVTSRTQLFGRLGGGRGRFGVAGEGPRFETAVATARVSQALTRKFGVHVQYSYLHYDGPPEIASVAPLGRFARQTVSAGFNLWIPIHSQVKAPLGPQ